MKRKTMSIWRIMSKCRDMIFNSKKMVGGVFIRGLTMHKKFPMSLFLFFIFSMNLIGSGFAQKDIPGYLISSELAKAGQLDIVWQNKLPIKTGENLDRMIIIKDRIYVLTDHSYLFCLNREKNNMIFSRPLTDDSLPVLGLELYDGKLITVAGNKLLEINPDLGTDINSTRLTFSATCPVARNNARYYVGSIDRKLHILKASDKIQSFEITPPRDSLVTAVVASDSFAVFATESGALRCFRPDAPKLISQFDTAGSIIEPITCEGQILFFASKDSNVYKLNVIGGRLIWKCSVDAEPDKAPVVTKQMVYQYAPGRGLAAIDKNTGKMIWQLQSGYELLSENGKRAYVITGTKKMVVMNNVKAKKEYSINLEAVEKFAVNVVDSKIYIADKSGNLVCLKPSE